MLLANSDPLSMILIPGITVWRSVGHEYGSSCPHRCYVKPMQPKKVSNQYMFRMTLARGFMWEPEATNLEKGIVLFIKEEPPEDWTNLIITGCSKSIKEAGSGGDERKAGGAVFAKLGQSISMDRYLNFRGFTGALVHKNYGLKSVEERRSLIDEVGMIIYQPRIVVRPVFDAESSWEYVYIESTNGGV